MRVCTACCDDLDDGCGFNCPRQCGYCLCEPCVKLALKDQAGENTICRLCKNKGKETKIGLLMVESLCGVGAIREVERELRSKVELELQRDDERREKGKAEMLQMKGRAEQLYKDLTERLNMRCPRCKTVFFDYDGCNALSCVSCSAAFCAICLHDCDDDAHGHVRESHGELYNKKLFETARIRRDNATVANFMHEISNEPFEVQEYVRIEVEKLAVPESDALYDNKDIAFLRSATQVLAKAMRTDRLSVLSETDQELQGHRLLGFETKHISPRVALPKDYQLTLTFRSGSICTVNLYKLENGHWKKVPLPNEDAVMTNDAKDSEREQGLKVDVLCNIRQQLRCGVVAFNGETVLYQTQSVKHDGSEKLGDDDVSIMFHRVSATGDIEDRPQSLCDIGHHGCSILGINQNRRLTILCEHVKNTEAEKLLVPSLKHYVGAGIPERLLVDLIVPPLSSISELNTEQQSVAHPLCLKTAREVAGPPGTGKTKTITELVRSILECTSFDVIVLSERNGAIDAIAEKIAGDCICTSKLQKTPSIKDIRLWITLLAFGSASLGPSTSLFTHKKKMDYHPELSELAECLKRKKAIQRRRRKEMLSLLASAIARLESELPWKPDPTKLTRSSMIQSMLKKTGPDDGLNTCMVVVSTLSAAKDVWAKLARVPLNALEENLVESASLDFVDIVGNLIPIRDQNAKKVRPWEKVRQEVRSATDQISLCLETVLKDPLFSFEEVERMQFDVRQGEDNLKAATDRVAKELFESARVFLCTIGSSHKLPTTTLEDEADATIDASDIATIPFGRPTIVIFDEAGCIPCYELLGLTRLGRDIRGILCVGDKHQLGPYNPGNFTQVGGRSQRTRRVQDRDKTIPSLLDVSAMDAKSSNKVNLTEQYRLPRDIASLLNARVYKGNFRTAVQFNAPLRGFHFVSVDSPLRGRENKYVNQMEINRCIEIINLSIEEGHTSFMVLTPYKHQQRLLQHTFSKHFTKEIPILTIDQCQGQEADIVLISLVQKPTSFLTLNRLNVALSRVRKRVYLVVDMEDFRQAARNVKWDCHLLANDLIEIATGGNESDSDDSL
ncbi:hypothetical protein MPSEU_000558800 [Mayamaea pseudoterrestris]|nr:hypothetical protein MPSEU_000558800 [Mayamaea pseudoterrestris]